MKRLLFFVAVFFTASVLFAQNAVNLYFTGAKVDGSYKRVSTVTVENLSRNWTETLIYPDTVLELTPTVGIVSADVESLSVETFPNPFNGKTMLTLQIPQSGDVLLQIFDLSGRKIVEQNRALGAGGHAFRISLQKPQVYMLVATTQHGRATVKLLNRSCGETNSIAEGGIPATFGEKRISTQRFGIGDFMHYTGYVINGTDTIGSNQITKVQSETEIIRLVFAEKPVVVTSVVDSLTGTSVKCGGNVTDDGGAVVYNRGVCWGTSQNPTIYDNHTVDGNGTGTFTSFVAGLAPGTTYYIRAYATNSAGTSYGSQISFVTPELPAVTTASITNIGVGTATCGGVVTSDGGAAVTARGVCWSTSQNPTIADNVTSDSNGAGAFVSSMTGLVSGTTYYVRAYATNIVGTGYGTEQIFTSLQLPIVQTGVVTNVLDTSAVFSGTVVSAGDSNVVARGFCWSTLPNPTINDSITIDSNGLGAYTDTVMSLSLGTTYYVRAYATGALGTGYGQEVIFATLGTPTVVTDSVSRITTASAVFHGNVTFNGGDSVSSRGFCWNTFPNPTTADNVVTSGSGTGNFRTNVSQLSPGTVYYVRAFATNIYGTGYGNQIVISTVNPVFSVSPLRAVGFSTGNLQYTTVGSHATADSTMRGTWRFALRQYDTLGAANALISDTNSGWIDLFGWGTSGFNNRHPYLNTTSIIAYDNGNADLSKTNYDWGTFNAVLNGGNQPGQWFTLNKEEWQYLLEGRDGAASKKGYATVCGVPGIMLLPDSWSNPIGTSFITGNGNGFATNVYNALQWSVMESYGAVFLPAAGYRYDSTGVTGVGTHGHYWTSSADSNSVTHYVSFSLDRTGITAYHNSQGRSVRLVRILSEKPEVVTDSIASITNETARLNGRLISEGRNAVTTCGFCWSTMPNPSLNDNVVYIPAQNPAAAPYNCYLSNLIAGTKYYVRFFAINSDGIGYGQQQIFTTLGMGVTGKFSVSANRKVRFAHGNLQYSTTSTHLDINGDTVTGQWQFAYYQYDMLRAANDLVSDTNRGWIDLFGWATSGYQTMPYETSPEDTLYGNDSLSIETSWLDWGVNNQIYSPLLDIFYTPDTWRTLTHAEFSYLLSMRPSASVKVGLAVINGVAGMVILPDEWQQPVGLSFLPGFAYGYSYNVYTPSQWERMENHGAVFLPAAGMRLGNMSSNVNDNGCYWTTTANGSARAAIVTFGNNSMTYGASLYRHVGCSVRLAKDEVNW